MYRVGELDQRITIQKETRTADGVGGFTSVWSQRYKAWAKKKDLSADEQTDYDRINAVGRTVFVIRKRSGILESDIIIHDNTGIVYNIRGIVPVADRIEYLEIETERGVAV